MLDSVSDEFRPWLAISSWAGIPREEMYPVTTSKKDALDWRDIDLKRETITIRREISKTNERRVIPICPALSKVLKPISQDVGRVTGETDPSDQKSKKVKSETKRLGELFGGWKANALRHSFVSYRCTQVGVANAAMELATAGQRPVKTTSTPCRKLKPRSGLNPPGSAEPLKNQKQKAAELNEYQRPFGNP